LELAVGTLAAVDAHVDCASNLGNELEQQPVFGLHVGEEGFHGGGARRIAEADVLLDEPA
jgi:hypothetical protein